MKRIISILLIITVLFTVGLTGCKKKDKKETEEEKTNCSYCNAEIVEGTLYCVRCGESLETKDLS